MVVDETSQKVKGTRSQHYSELCWDLVPFLLIEVKRETGVGITGSLVGIDEDSCSFEVSLGDLYAEILREIVRRVFEVLDGKMMELSVE